MFQRKAHITKVSHYRDSSTSANILLQRGSLSTPLKTRCMVSAWLTTDHRPRLLSLHPLFCFTRADCWQAVKEAYSISARVVWGWYTWQSLNVSDDLRHAVGKRFHLEDELAVCPRSNHRAPLDASVAVSDRGLDRMILSSSDAI